ncbi:hypothetical protein D3C87_1492960 [compost metagenome]
MTAARNGQVPAADPTGLFDQGDMGEAAAIELSGGGQAGYSGANDADSMTWVRCLGDAVFLLDQRSIVEAQVRWTGKTSSPFVGCSALCTGGGLGHECGVVVA